MSQHGSTMEHLPLGSLRINERAQRRLIPSSVKKLAGGWDMGKVGVITVSIRNNTAYVVDGQHRVRAGLSLGLSDTKVKCHVFRDLSVAEEAEMFLALNDNKPVSAYDKFRVGLMAGDPLCRDVEATLSRYGLQISDQVKDGNVACVESVMRLARRGLLDEACRVLVAAWGTRAVAFERVIVGGLGTVLGHFNGEVDRDAFSHKLASYRGGPAALRGDARGLADYKPISITRAAAELMVDQYNKGKRSGKLVLPA